jgi:hypothetical protein
MKTALKTLGLSIAIVVILSITVKDEPLFSYVYEFISPATKTAQDVAEDFFKRSISSTQSYSKKLFDNSVPRMRDSVKSKMSSHKRLDVEEPAERITAEEKEKLDELIKNH